MKIVNMGIIGAGWIVSNMHIPAIQKLNNMNIVAIYDTDQKRANEVAQTFHIKNVCTSIEEFYLLDIDAVVIATPNFTHVEYSIHMLEHGIHVLCEKPVALHADEIRRIISIEKKNKVIYMPGFVNRWRDDISEVNKIIQENKIGDITEISAGWLRRNGVPRPGTWFTKRELSGGGVLVDLGSHVIDICLMFLGSKDIYHCDLRTSLYESEKSEGSASWFEAAYTKEYSVDVEDTASAEVKYDDGTKLNVNLSWLAPIEGDCTYFYIQGTEGQIKLRTLFGLSDDRLWNEDSLEVKCKDDFYVKRFIREEKATKQAFEKMHEYFANAIINQSSCITSLDALKNVDLIEQLYNAEKIKKKVFEKVELEEIVHG